MNLLIDIGNSFTKIAVFNESNIIARHTKGADVRSQISNLLKEYPQIVNGILSSVSEYENAIIDVLKDKLDFFIELDSHTPLPIENKYKTKETLGKDRLAAIVGANNIFPDTNVLVVDAGTTITFDLVNSMNQYLGGNISPGLEMRFKALNMFTDKLPHVKKNNYSQLLGDSTESAIVAGVQNGIVFEVEQYINVLLNKHEDLRVILTGGDSIFFDKRLKNVIFAEPDLIFLGLNKILNFNVKKD